MIAISIPVHENPDVIIDQISNIKKYVPDSLIVLHISKSFYDNYTDERLLGIENVFINPEHLVTRWGDVISPHLSNFCYIQAHTKFDYFVMHSSNDMYVRYGVDEYIKKYDAGFQIRKITQKHTHWWPGNVSYNDFQINRICLECGQSMIIASQIEGSFYRSDIMSQIVRTIQKHYVFSESKVKYTREEVFFSTVASSFVDWSKVGKPTTFSEVHRFDRTLWKTQEVTRKLYRPIQFLIPQKFYDYFEKICNNCLFKSRFYKITKRDVRQLRNNPRKKIDSNRFLDDGSGLFQLYDGENIFSVKRISRNYADRVRKFIRNLEG